MGDMNDNPDDQSIREGLRAKGKTKELKPGDLINPWGSWLEKGQGTLAHRDRWGLFDQIMLSQSWLDKTGSGYHFFRDHIFNPAYLAEYSGRYRGYPMRTWEGNRYRGGYSDHFPVYMVFLRNVVDYQ